MNSFAILSLFSSYFLSRFGLQITPDFSLSFSYIFLYFFCALGCGRGWLVLDAKLALIFLWISFLAITSFLEGEGNKSLTSLALFLFCYIPFCIKPVRTYRANYLCSLCFFFCFLICISGIIQFALQFIIKSPYLFNFKSLIPSFFQNKDLANTVIPIGGFIKSNGFFLTEPSAFSQTMAFGIFLVILLDRSWFFILLFFIGLLFSFSGTGLLLLPIIWILSMFRIRSVSSIFFNFALAFFILIAFFSNFVLFKDRVQEFYSGPRFESSSASQRFINPAIVIKDSWSQSPKSFFFGSGPGSLQRQARDFDFHTPTWAKLPFEYGVLGALSLIYFLFAACCRSNVILPVFLFLFFQWLYLGGHLLSCDILSILFFITVIFKNE